MTENAPLTSTKYKLPPSLTTVTTFSKIIALFLFIALPIIGFFLGINYQKQISPPCLQHRCPNVAIIPYSTPSNQATDSQTFCQSNSGTWDSQYQECTNLPSSDAQSLCTQAGGVYNECASPCRHNTDLDIGCAAVCVPVCTYPGKTQSSDLTITGEVVDHLRTALPNGPDNLLIQTSTGQQYQVQYLYSQPSTESPLPTCTNKHATDAGRSIEISDTVEVYGYHGTNDTILTCDSPDYYIKKLSQNTQLTPCSKIPSYGNNPAAGITFLQNYCSGSTCRKNNQTECEAVDVVTLKSDNTLNDSWQPDGIGDCIWNPELPDLNQCQVKY